MLLPWCWSAPQGCSDLIRMEVCRQSLKSHTHVQGNFGRKRYPFLGILLDASHIFGNFRITDFVFLVLVRSFEIPKSQICHLCSQIHKIRSQKFQIHQFCYRSVNQICGNSRIKYCVVRTSQYFGNSRITDCFVQLGTNQTFGNSRITGFVDLALFRSVDIPNSQILSPWCWSDL